VAADLDLRVLTLPDELDPADFLKQYSVHDFQRHVAAAVDAVDHKIAIELAGLDLQQDTHRAAVALDNVLQTIARRPSGGLHGANLLREQQILTRVARRFAIDVGMLARRIEELRGRARPARRSVPTETSATNERELLELFALQSDLVAVALDHIDAVQITHPACQALFECFRRRCAAGFEADCLSVMTDLEEFGLKSLLAEIDDLAREKLHHVETPPAIRLDEVIRAFGRRSLEVVNRQAIAQLPDLADPLAETDALMAILERARQRQQLTSPTGVKEGSD
jgi:DNA primase